jgi:hypothetical protein
VRRPRARPAYSSGVQLTEPDGDRLKLEVLGYQFPHEKTDSNDANWLLIGLEASNNRGTWRSTDPSLDTSEVSYLAEWLEALSLNHDVESELHFTEPNLSFELVARSDGSVRLRAWFELESRPVWARSAFVGDRDANVDLTVPVRDLKAAADSLRADLRRFPARLVS